MSYFLRNGNTFRVADNASMDIQRSLPAGNYVVKQDQHGNLFLEMVDPFERLGKIYGDTTKNAGRIMTTFLSRKNKGTGVLLTGEKGSGKTLLAKTLSLDCADQGIPTILINAPWRGDGFNKLIQDIDQPCMVLFDEFEKVYDSDEQEQMLTLLDGVYPTQKLFVLTCNDKWRIDHHMRNRPGRIFYMMDFRGLSQEFITEYCEDNLDEKQYIAKICSIACLFAEFNFDMLKALVEEMNRYHESPVESMKMLNARAEFSGNSDYDVKLIRDGKIMYVRHPEVFNGNPLNGEGVEVNYSTVDHNNNGSRPRRGRPIAQLGRSVDVAEITTPDFDGDEEEYGCITFDQNDLVKVLPAQGVYEFEMSYRSHTYKLIMTKRASQTNFNYGAF
jgi:hypothetical protein